ncbi:hypothetical protein EDC39_11262 [Geothermobacter ehrlichii]|uniref:Uncharacterized protein n=1 Tax=Geothermobacter ehrlichii TaxID=213224 RepID=A0A5D3WJL0_9BACT|nr:hypothetical protein [Geothermobacter ehrlichii]TYO96774.1 hypothetical protein EDC39_11262 [Geothermobacter ehrlichii]
MSILNMLKKFRLPAFDDEFVQDPVDKHLDNRTDEELLRAKALNDMHRYQEREKFLRENAEAIQEATEEAMEDFSRQNDPTYPGSLAYLYREDEY